MIPPNTPICKDVIPQTSAVAPLNMLSVPPLIVIMALIDACMMKNAITADNAATSFSFFAIPIATPIANRIGRLANTIFPASFMTVKIMYGIVPGPIAFKSP